ncbi:hypothetical protein [uncultured Clostridium sp.]|uniref:hypothetical protein n=1 Tax=uncultured Clostridium sp. TaxID=59620 RepID=UPI00263802BF|nr:hypothetical protein [uncultured Clostridium sp.]
MNIIADIIVVQNMAIGLIQVSSHSPIIVVDNSGKEYHTIPLINSIPNGIHNIFDNSNNIDFNGFIL